MVVKAGVAFLLGLVQVLVVAAGVQLACERWRLRHVVLWRQTETGQSVLSHRYFTTDADAGGPNKSKIAPRHKHRRHTGLFGNWFWTRSTPFPPLEVLKVSGLVYLDVELE